MRELKPLPHEFVFKVLWRATALTFKVEGKNYDHSMKRLHRILDRMDGGRDCLEILYLRQNR